MKAYLIHLCLVSSLILLISPQHAHASHVYGGSIYYACQNACTYTVYVEAHYDCFSSTTAFPPATPAVPLIRFAGSGGSCSQPSAVGGWVLDSYLDATPICPTDSTACTNPLAPIGGVLVAIYHREYDFCVAGACNSYVASWSACCRGGSVTSGANGTVYLETEIDLSTTPCNNAPEFAYPPVTFVCVGTGSSFSQAAFDKDGDSLVYSLSTCQDGAGLATSYNPGFTPTNPMGSAWQVSIDVQTGKLSILPTPGALLMSPICIEVTEYRNGSLIGSISREMLVVALNCTGSNALPQTDSISLVSGGIEVSPGKYEMALDDSLEIMLEVSDADMAQSLDVLLPLHLGTVSKTVVGSNPATIVFQFKPSQAGDFLLPIQIHDDACSIMGSIVEGIEVRVMGYDYPPVHPGDANFDQVANNLDLLALGITFGQQGPQRFGATTQWVPQNALDWGDTLVNGADFKHSDCTGDGIVDSLDVAPILLNYGSTHTFSKTSAVGSPLYMIPPSVTYLGGDTARIPIHWGDMVDPLTDAYGLAFSITYDSSKVAKAWIEFKPSWFATPGTDMLTLDKDLPNFQRIDVGVSRNDHALRAGYGYVADLIIVMDDDLNKRVLPMTLGLENAFAINNKEEEIPVDAQDAQINLGTAIDYSLQTRVSLFPNPTKDKMYIDGLRPDELQAARLYDVQGRSLSLQMYKQQGQYIFNLNHLQEGFYLLEIQTAKGKAIFKVIKQH